MSKPATGGYDPAKHAPYTPGYDPQDFRLRISHLLILTACYAFEFGTRIPIDLPMGTIGVTTGSVSISLPIGLAILILSVLRWRKSKPCVALPGHVFGSLVGVVYIFHKTSSFLAFMLGEKKLFSGPLLFVLPLLFFSPLALPSCRRIIKGFWRVYMIVLLILVSTQALLIYTDEVEMERYLPFPQATFIACMAAKLLLNLVLAGFARWDYRRNMHERDWQHIAGVVLMVIGGDFFTSLFVLSVFLVRFI